MTEHVYIASKKEGAREAVSTAHETAADARKWLREQIEYDPMMGTFEWRKYNKTVAEGSDGDVYGYVEAVQWAEHFEDSLVEQYESEELGVVSS